MAVGKGAPNSGALAKEELDKLQGYLRKVFANKTIEVRARQRAVDAAEFYVGGEFLGIVSKEMDEGEVSYQLTLSILELDLDNA
jgi:hypothetical protein